MRRKSEVYSWRVSPALKASLEEEARGRRGSVAELLDKIVAEYLVADRRGGADDGAQRRLRAKAMLFAGSIAGRDPRRGARAHERVRARLRRLNDGR
jgi:hypothetical protein